ncbi:MAG: YgcG family protein [Xanthobacteraceae bacterium]|nr:YgcG family protein [Xanthobacteraceae bacterium]
MRKRRFCPLLTLLAVALACAAHALTFPQLTGRVVDEAGILDPPARAALEQKLAEFEAKTTGQLVVVTLKSLQGTSIEDYGYQLGRHWGIGQKDKNSGALLIVAPNERKVRIEVGYGLEGQLTDAVSKLIIENSIVPRLRAGDVAGGITRGVDDIVQALTVDPDEWKARAQRRPDGQPAAMDVIVLVLFLIVVFMIMRAVARQGGADPRTMRGRGARRGGPIFMPVPFPSGSGSGSSDWSWPGSSGGGFSGGGFSGGGGSFGGGGASGSW